MGYIPSTKYQVPSTKYQVPIAIWLSIVFFATSKKKKNNYDFKVFHFSNVCQQLNIDYIRLICVIK